MSHWFRSVVVPCSLLALAFPACSGGKSTGTSSAGQASDGAGGTSTSSISSSNGTSNDASATNSDSTSSTGDATGTGGTSASSTSDATGSGGTGGTSTEQTGISCETADDCYTGIARDELAGDIMCLDRVEDGYCTHECQEDADCCSVEGECQNSLSQVCSPFENTGLMLCFLSCEEEDIALGVAGASGMDANDFCQQQAGPEFICRATGGGSQNRRVCVPGDPNMGAGGQAGAGAGGQAGSPGAN